MADTEIKVEKNIPKGKDIVEERVKPTVIRRRKVRAPKEEAVPIEAGVPAEKAPAKEAPVEGAAPGAEKVKEKEKKVKEVKKPEIVEEKKRPLTIIAQPEDVGEGEPAEGAEKTGVAQPHLTGKELEKLVKKPPRRKKSRAEMQYEDIRRHGGLKQYARIVTTADQQTISHEPSRIFKPGKKTRKRKAPKKGFKKTEITEPKAIKKIIKISEGITVSELSQSMGVKISDIIKRLMGLGVMAAVNQTVDADTAALIATEYGYEVENIGFKEDEFLKAPHAAEDDVEKKYPRPPVVTVMGHVDHGKTSILDVIRETDVATGEAGGITQHIGAYTITRQGKAITFVDTPGHEAFTHMRARGAQVTDIVILVVAADDGVMPQTKEAIDHAKAAGVPIIVAINKIDKPNANSDKVKRELSEVELLPEDWGGETICVPTSAKTKEGIDQLLEMVLLQAEMLELTARRGGRAEGIVIESKMDKRRGPVVTGIVKQGTLKLGDVMISGPAWGNAKALINDKGESVNQVLPSQPVEIMGLSEVPEAGERFMVIDDEKAAKLIGEKRLQKQRDELLAKRSKVTLEDLRAKVEQGEAKDLNIIVKTDVKGVADAVKDSLPGLSTKEVKINVLHTGVGGITESDVMLADVSNAVVLGFNVVADSAARDLAEKKGVEIKRYSVIYEMLDDVKKAVAGMLAPKEVEKVLGRVEVREIFKVPKVGVVAGCMVTSGKIIRSASVRLLRDNVIIHDGKIASLRRFKDDVREVVSGQECGMGIEKFSDIKVGDEIEAYLIEEIATTWEESREEVKSKIQTQNPKSKADPKSE